MDCAVDLAQCYRTQLSERFDVDEGVERLIYRPTLARHTADTVECLRMISDLRLHMAESSRLAHERIDELERALNTTKFLVARLGARLTTGPARLWRRYINSR
jgi:hypothetical protein